MKAFKGFAIVLLFLCLLITLVSLLMPSTVMTANTVSVRAGRNQVMSLIVDLQNWKKWYPVFTDSASQQSIKWVQQTDHLLAWEQHGKKYQLQIQKSDTNYCQVVMRTENQPDLLQIFTATPVDIQSQQIEWKMVMHLKWVPWEKFSGIFFDKAVGPACSQGLEQMKKIAEQQSF